jgi:hypothetical protein
MGTLLSVNSSTELQNCCHVFIAALADLRKLIERLEQVHILQKKGHLAVPLESETLRFPEE